MAYTAPPLKSEISDTYPNPTNAVARIGFAKLYDYITNLLGSTGNPLEARTALQAAKSGDNNDITSLSNLSGNVIFMSTSQRIKGDFNNATIASRTLFQSFGANSSTNLGIIPSGTGTTSSLVGYSSSTPANASTFSLTVVDGFKVSLISGKTGTGTYLPFAINVGGTDIFSITAAGQVGINSTATFGWDTSLVPLNIGDLVTLFGSANSANTACNLFFDGTNYRTKYSGAGSLMSSTNSGTFLWYGTSSVAANTIVTPVQTLSLDVNGNLLATADISGFSDERLKTNWSQPDVNTFIDKLSKVKHGEYDRTDIPVRQAGASAQDFYEILPSTVSRQANGYYTLAYGNAALVSSIVLAKKIIELEAEINKLKGNV